MNALPTVAPLAGAAILRAAATAGGGVTAAEAVGIDTCASYAWLVPSTTENVATRPTWRAENAARCPLNVMSASGITAYVRPPDTVTVRVPLSTPTILPTDDRR